MSDAARPWVLLRGLTREAGHWGDLPQRIAVTYGVPVHPLDLPGNGTRWAERSPARIDALADAVRAAAIAQGVAWPANVLALSLGGMVATSWAVRFPQQVARLVLAGTSARNHAPLHWRLRPRAALPLLIAVLRGDDAAIERAVLAATSAVGDARVLTQWIALRLAHPVSRRNAAAQLLAAARYRAPAQLPVPVRLLAGARDALVDPRCSARLAQAWGAQLRVHPDAGHDLPLDAPDWVVAQLD
ncbi:MAG: alpha/beta hydrolase [Burkholderiaceae bacterium]|nr:alpha/beta hydrolase [Burkholderiaceae bacterium]